ncbi:SMAD/FHA domain-containing protein [Daldinia caldariorum]|uniref:SMAD/FHA domain-containing protein n=1 Tax=Daldinia caldariorum TaxID=326644 RepID=UPI002008CB9D|nr:SMAD/FHA domain-containing protein [Daldinia caldariorum]KAI1464929.1 SMAD/FHA domain-containing protein [Daldinia caldariorum]
MATMITNVMGGAGLATTAILIDAIVEEKKGLVIGLETEDATTVQGLPTTRLAVDQSLRTVIGVEEASIDAEDHAITTGVMKVPTALGRETITTTITEIETEEPPKPKEKPNYGNTGALAAASNSVIQSDGSKIVLKYHEPPEARKASPKDQWKLFVFKGQDIVDTISLGNRSCWLVGRELAVVDLPAEHPSISKQHAVIQFRYIEKRNEYGDKIGKVKPYLIDLESANGTMLNGKRVPESRYLELRDKDMIQFGQSTREYVIMLAPKD